MEHPPRFQRGDAVVHPRRPEWGRGIVKDAQPITHQGRSAQRLAVDFANHGRVVINTAVAALTPPGSSGGAGEQTSPQQTTQGTNEGFSMTTTQTSGGWLDSLERAASGQKHELWALTTDMKDPFASLEDRLAATLRSYRFSTEARSLIEWAVIQTGLDDPMTRYTRSEMEQAFPRYARDRDQHLKELVKQFKRRGQHAELQRILNRTQLPAARSALDRAMRG